MSTKKFWLDFGGVQLQVFDTIGFAGVPRWTGVKLPDAHGRITFEPVFRYKGENIDFDIVDKLKGWRIRIEIHNVINDGSDTDSSRLKGVLNVINWEQTSRFEKIRIAPKMIDGIPDWQQKWFENMHLESGIEITEPEIFDCYQELQPLRFVGRKLLKPNAIPNWFAGMSRETRRDVNARATAGGSLLATRGATGLKPNVKLTLTIENEGSVDVNGASQTGPGEFELNFVQDSIITLTATVTNGDFDEWNGDASGSEATIQITMDEDKNITAIFEE